MAKKPLTEKQIEVMVRLRLAGKSIEDIRRETLHSRSTIHAYTKHVRFQQTVSGKRRTKIRPHSSMDRTAHS